MSASTIEGFSYFELPRARLSSSDSHSLVSPSSHAPVTIPRTSRKVLRPGLRQHDRSQSDSTTLRLTPYVATIQEGLPSHYSTAVQTPVDEGLVSYIDFKPKHSRKRFSSSRSSKEVLESKVLSSSYETKLYQKNQYRQTLRGLSKTLVRPHAGRSASDNYIPSLRPEPWQRSRSVGIVPASIEPLRPPSTMTKPSTPTSEHLVTVETPFPDTLSQGILATHIAQSSKRRSSINPRQLFSVPVAVFRKRKGRSSEYETSETDNPSTTSNSLARFAKDHKSNLRRQQTTNLLLRVTSMLHDVKRPDPKGHTGSNRTVSLAKANTLHRYQKDVSKSPNSTKAVRPRDIRLEDTESQCSSIADLNTCHPPNNTPDEQAKYIVVNQYGELEEFLKVDISVRGQTSYLPSEARRIHTPPFPSEDRSGTRRGFFFDYNLPFTNHNDKERQKKLRTLSSSDHQMSSSHRDVPRSATTRSSSRKRNTKIKTGDWYGTQLARIDSESDIEDQPPQEHENNAASSSSFDLEQQRRDNEAQLDYNIPEHLPTSPLCPRHPRYWRAVKKKGSQFRGCWMHGFGEFGDQEKTRYGIVDRSEVRENELQSTQS